MAVCAIGDGIQEFYHINVSFTGQLRNSLFLGKEKRSRAQQCSLKNE
jgi:hypothetical protein